MRRSAPRSRRAWAHTFPLCVLGSSHSRSGCVSAFLLGLTRTGHLGPSALTIDIWSAFSLSHILFSSYPLSTLTTRVPCSSRLCLSPQSCSCWHLKRPLVEQPTCHSSRHCVTSRIGIQSQEWTNDRPKAIRVKSVFSLSLAIQKKTRRWEFELKGAQQRSGREFDSREAEMQKMLAQPELCDLNSACSC